MILSDVGRQIALLTDAGFEEDHGEILKRLGEDGGERIKRLYDFVTLSFARSAGQRGEEREATYRAVRKAIADAAGISPREHGGEGSKG